MCDGSNGSMRTFVASRLADGNKLFPPKITLKKNGIRVKIPGFWNGKEIFLYYEDISSVSVNTPMIGFATISFNAQGTFVRVHGFTKAEVKIIKNVIDAGYYEDEDEDENEDKTTPSIRTSNSTLYKEQKIDNLEDNEIEDEEEGPNKQLDILMQLLVISGKITNEKVSLMRHIAEERDEDPDEIEILLDSKLHERISMVNPQKVNIDGLYPDKITKLLQAAFIDGTISERKREILIRKADDEGIDTEEFKMVLSAIEYQENFL